MQGPLKVLGLVLIASLAMGTASVSVAAAEEFSFYSAAPRTDLTGHQTSTQSFSFDVGTTTCESVSHSGEFAEEEVGEVELASEFSECTADPFGTTAISMNSCRFVLTPATKEESTYQAGLDLACESGDSVTVTVTVFGTVACTVHIPAQELGEVTLEEVSGEEEVADIGMTASIEGIEYDQTAGKGLAPCSNAENETDGTYEGQAILSGSFEEYEMPIGMEAPKPAIDVEPADNMFSLNQERTLEIHNLTKAKLTIVVARADPNFFSAVDDKCTKQVVDADETCKIKIKCIKTFAGIAFLNAVSADPRDADAAILRCS
jgi:hypothetical protein